MRLINKRFSVHHGAKGYWEVVDKKTGFFYVMTTRREVRKALRMSFTYFRNLVENWGYEENPYRWLLP